MPNIEGSTSIRRIGLPSWEVNQHQIEKNWIIDEVLL